MFYPRSVAGWQVDREGFVEMCPIFGRMGISLRIAVTLELCWDACGEARSVVRVLLGARHLCWAIQTTTVTMALEGGGAWESNPPLTA